MKIPTVLIIVGPEAEILVMEPSLDSPNHVGHSHLKVALAETRSVIFEIDEYLACPTERNVPATDHFVVQPYRELDPNLHQYLRD